MSEPMSREKHQLVLVHSARIKKCGCCGKSVWGLIRGRYRCRSCLKDFHRHCLVAANTECECHGRGSASAQAPPSPAATPTLATTTTTTNSAKTIDLPPLVEEILNKYGEEDVEGCKGVAIGPEGLVRFCSSLGFDIMDIKGLVLLWLCNADNCGLLTPEELCTLVERLGNVTSEEQIAQGLTDALNRVNEDTEELRKMYDFSFHSMKDNSESRSVDAEMCAQMLEIVLGGRPAFHNVNTFIDFLNSGVRSRVNADQWHCIFDFCKKYSEDLEGYDEAASWPCLIDEFVSFAKDKMKQKHDE